MKFRRLVAACALTLSLAASSPARAEEVQPIPGPKSERIEGLLVGFLGAFALGIEISADLL